MVDVSSQSNKVNITVSSSGVSSNVNASGDTSHYYSEKAREWAISNRIVDGVDYSSKYYAGRANQSALNAQSFAQSAQDSYNNLQDSVDGALSTVNDTVQGAITTIDTKSSEAIEIINNSIDGVIEDIEAEANEQIANIERTGFYMRDDKLYFINSNGEEEEFKSGGSGFNLFDTKISDYILDGDSALGWALQGTYVNGAVYPDFYAKCIAEYNEATETETVNGVTVKVTANGHKFYNIADKASIDGFYNTMGTAWFYGIDTENERIFLPRDKYFAVNGVAPVAGNGIALGVTNGTTQGGLSSYYTAHYAPCYLPEGYGVSVSDTPIIGSAGYVNGVLGITTDPTKSGIEAHLTANEDKYLYICVGNTIVNEEQIDVSKVLSEAVLRSSLEQVQVVVETYQNGTSWYRIWSDGWCEQGGFIAKSATSVALLKVYKDTSYGVITDAQDYTGSDANLGVNSKTTTSFAIKSSNHIRYWRACGYIW